MSPSVLDEDGQQATAARKTGAVDGVGTAGGGAAAAATTAATTVAAAARPSNVKRARPLSQCTPLPDPIPVEKKKAYLPKEVDHLSAVLATFEAPEEESLVRSGEVIAKHHQEEVEDLFKLIARVGNPLLPWETIRPVFLWKIRHVMEESVRVERLADARILAEKKIAREVRGCSTPPPRDQVKGGVPYAPPAEGWEDEKSELRDSYRFIMGRAASLTAAPFTFQRICELLVDPLQHYKTAGKLFRALEKCINVVSCVDDSGARITGVEPEDEEPMDEDAANGDGRIEQRFFGKVDECDEGMEEDGENQENSAAAAGAAGDSADKPIITAMDE